MKLRVTIDGESNLLEIKRNAGESAYTLSGVVAASGKALVEEIRPGLFSVLLGRKSFTVFLVARGSELEVWAEKQRFVISVADLRDRPVKGAQQSSAGPVEIRAQMPGKVIKLLVEAGANVEAGQGVIVVEAMKMQNEMKTPKTGRVAQVFAVEGATVAAGEKLMVIE